MTDVDRERLRDLADRLSSLRQRLGPAYWCDSEAEHLRRQMRTLIGTLGSWSEDRPPLHARLREQAAWESQLAHLLWPAPAGRDG